MSRCEFRAYQTAPKKAGGAPVTEKIADPFDKLRVGKGGDDDEYALVIKRVYGDKFELESTTLVVNSPHLLGVFRQLIGSSYTTVASDFTKPLELESPFQMLFHYVSLVQLFLLPTAAHVSSSTSGTSWRSSAERPKTAMFGCI